METNVKVKNKKRISMEYEIAKLKIKSASMKKNWRTYNCEVKLKKKNHVTNEINPMLQKQKNFPA